LGPSFVVVIMRFCDCSMSGDLRKRSLSF